MSALSLNVDFHSHSTVSDGMLSPSMLAARAKANGVDVWALTDHDELGGIPEARAAAAALNLRFVTGVEISITWAGKTIHIVGLNIDENNHDLIQGLAKPVQGASVVSPTAHREAETAKAHRG